MEKIILLLLAACASHLLCAQGVGINTLNPDSSAALDIQSDQKGLLIPRVNLQSINDGTTIHKPEHSLLIFNTNQALLGGDGFYYNSGTKDTPKWTKIFDELSLPQVAFAAKGWMPGQIIDIMATKRVVLKNESYDIGDNYDDAQNESGSVFTAPFQGIYHFDINALIPWGGKCPLFILYRIHNGVSEELYSNKNYADYGRNYEFQLSTDMNLENGDQIFLEVTNTYNGSSIENPDGTVGTLVSDQSNFKANFSGRLIIKL